MTIAPVLGFGVVLLTAVVGVAIATYRRPDLFIPIVAVFAILGSGPKILGHPIFDEAILISAILGFALKTFRRGLGCFDSVRFFGVEALLFAAFILYMAFKSIEGVLYLEDWRAMRFFVFFVSIFIAANILWTWPADDRSKLDLGTIVLTTSAVHFALYIAQGVVGSYVFGDLGRFSTQGYYWSASAYTTFPILLAGPVALRAFHERFILPGTCLALALAAGIYFDSRVALGVLLFFVIVGTKPRAWRHILILGVAIYLVLAVYSLADARALLAAIAAQLDALVESALFLISPRSSDADRQIALIAALQTAWSDPVALLFGQGYYSHRVAMLPALQAVDPVIYTSPVRTTGVALIVDIGVLGVLLLAANCALTSLAILRNRLGKGLNAWLPWAAVPVLSFCWLFISSITDLVLLYLLIMPGGLLVKLHGQYAVPQPGAAAADASLSVKSGPK